MRYIVFGAGAIGGLVGGLMAEAGEDVVLIARGAHADAITRDGLTIESAERTAKIAVPVVTDPGAAEIQADDTVLMAMKSQDTVAALEALSVAAPEGVTVACLQNGVENERSALRLFPAVYAVCVMCPATHLQPGVVVQGSAPIPGLLDIGRYPAGTDAASARISAAVRTGGFESIERPDIMRWKYRKLLMNLANATQALLSGAGAGTVRKRAQAEGEACLEAAGIDYASAQEDEDRRGDLLRLREVQGQTRHGGSTWQSLERAARSVETDFLNGEIALLGRLHGVATPVNDLLQQLARQAVRRQDAPGGLTVDRFDELLKDRADGR